MRNARLDDSAGIKIAGRTQQPQMCRWYHSNGRNEEELKSLLKGLKESEKSALKFNIQKMKIMASSPIFSWQIDGKKVETVADFIILGSKITVGGDCSHRIKRHLLLRREAMTNLDSILKSRDITLPTKVHIIKVQFFQQSSMDVRVGP